MADNPDLFLLLPHFAGDPDPPSPPTPPPLWSPPFASLSSSASAADLDTASDYSDDDLASLSLDLFRHRPRSPSHHRPFIPPVFWSHNDLEELERPGCLGLDSVFDGEEDESETVDIADRGLIVPDWTSDDFFVGLRRCPSDSTEFSRAQPMGEGGLRVTGIDSDSDSDEQIVAMFDEQMVAEIGMDSDDGAGQYGLPDEFDVPLRWDTLQLGDDRRDVIEGFEWEEIEDEERDTIDIMVLGHDVRSDESRVLTVTEVEDEAVVRNVDWQILLAMNDLGRSPLDPDEVGAYFEDQHGLVYASDYEPYEVLFGQLSEQNSNAKGSPPAAKSVVENLPSVVLRKEDTTEIDAVCAVCKDGIQAEEQVKRLPCLHHYHEDCILPWLGIRNTCPLCRFELPTDDPEYEKRKARRANGVISLDESQLRYDFEMLPEASIL